MKLSFKYRIYPNQNQREALDNVLYLCRFLYNSALQERKTHYAAFGKDFSYNKQAAELKELPHLFPEYRQVYSQTRQQVLKQLDTAFKNFFRRVKQKAAKAGYPRFKGKDRFHSILFPQVKADLAGGGGVKLLPNKKLQVFGIPGEIKVFWHRPFQGRCKQARIVKEADQYYLVLSCDDVPLNLLPKTGKTIALDLGLQTFAVGDQGQQFQHPQPLKRQKDKLIKAQKELSRKKRSSKNRGKAKLHLAKTHRKIANVRKDFLHKLALLLVQQYDIIIVEKLNIQKMLEEQGFEVSNSNIADASWSMFVQFLLYKAERAGKEVRFVNPAYTSKTCSCCGKIKKDLPLQERTYHCDACGIAIDRDLNAAKNIKAKGLGMSPAAGIKPASEA